MKVSTRICGRELATCTRSMLHRVTREAAASGGSGCAKFLDELLVWRELAYSFCFHRWSLPWCKDSTL